MDKGHDALRVGLGALALGMLEADERRAALQHADECPECSAELDDFLELAALLWPAAVPRPQTRAGPRTRANDLSTPSSSARFPGGVGRTSPCRTLG